MDKVYYPQTINDAPFPNEQQGIQLGTGNVSNQNETYGQSTQLDSEFAKPLRAVEVLSSALNTQSRKVLQSFDLQASGGFKIGQFEQGVTGDVQLTPVGIVARDSAGNYTLVVDGETGNVTIKGTLQAGTLIGGELVLGDGSTVLDQLGIRSTTNFLKAITSRGVGQQITGTSYVDFTNSSQTFTVQRTTLFIFVSHIALRLIESGGNTGNAIVFMDIDGTISNASASILKTGESHEKFYDVFFPVLLSKGTHTVKLKGRFESVFAGTPILNIGEYYFHRIQLGS